MLAEAPTTAPWWGVPTIAGSFLIIGGALSFLSTYFSDRRRARQELERLALAEGAHRQQDVRAAAASLLVETRNVYEAFKSNFVVDDAGLANRIVGPTIGLERTDQAYWTLIFIAPQQIEKAAHDLFDATKLFRRYIRGTYELEPFTQQGWHDAKSRYFASRKAFIYAVKSVGEVKQD